MFSRISLFGATPGITVSSVLGPGEDVRVVFTDREGKDIIPDDMDKLSTEGVQQTTALCPKATIADIQSVRLQVRPYNWTLLKNLPLTPPAP